MPCHAAMNDKFVTVKVTDTVEKTLKALKKAKVEYAAIVDEDESFFGAVSLKSLFKNILPVSVSIGNDFISSGVSIGAAPGIAKRLNKIGKTEVSLLVDREVGVVPPDAPLWQGVKVLAEKGGVIFVLDTNTHKPLGVITMQSALDELQRLGK